MSGDVVTLLLCGDVMLGRGVDQILPHPGDPTLREPVVKDARDYVALAERANGPISRPVDFSWPWGDALRVLDRAAPDVRIVNLETSVTRSDQFDPRKRVHYRMDPDNLPGLSVARPDVSTVANNHVLDFGHPGLRQTLAALSGAGLRTAGAGSDAKEARRPAAIPLDREVRVLVFAMGMASSGIPPSWAATDSRPGVHVLPASPDAAAANVVESLRQHKKPGDIAVVSLHWGSNWGYEVTQRQIDVAHALIDGGVDVVFGHSSHHLRPIEVYRGKLILYGCGDSIDDYEGIAGHEAYRNDLRLLYLASVAPDTGALTGLRMVAMRARRMRLERAPSEDSHWLRATLDRISRPFGSRVATASDGELSLEWNAHPARR
ncbi:MAG: CapA family protein [Actinobacteria bacterium]|nr:CapA family protein [Actinomycetota bacterium]